MPSNFSGLPNNNSAQSGGNQFSAAKNNFNISGSIGDYNIEISPSGVNVQQNVTGELKVYETLEATPSQNNNFGSIILIGIALYFFMS